MSVNNLEIASPLSSKDLLVFDLLTSCMGAPGDVMSEIYKELLPNNFRVKDDDILKSLRKTAKSLEGKERDDLMAEILRLLWECRLKSNKKALGDRTRRLEEQGQHNEQHQQQPQLPIVNYDEYGQY